MFGYLNKLVKVSLALICLIGACIPLYAQSSGVGPSPGGPDSDMDGFPDSTDLCVNEAGPMQGCPMSISGLSIPWYIPFFGGIALCESEYLGGICDAIGAIIDFIIDFFLHLPENMVASFQQIVSACTDNGNDLTIDVESNDVSCGGEVVLEFPDHLIPE